eukprot:Lankesteria_metandrocarpae@DN3318_c0_g1_i4.p1
MTTAERRTGGITDDTDIDSTIINDVEPVNGNNNYCGSSMRYASLSRFSSKQYYFSGEDDESQQPSAFTFCHHSIEGYPSMDTHDGPHDGPLHTPWTRTASAILANSKPTTAVRGGHIHTAEDCGREIGNSAEGTSTGTSTGTGVVVNPYRVLTPYFSANDTTVDISLSGLEDDCTAKAGSKFDARSSTGQYYYNNGRAVQQTHNHEQQPQQQQRTNGPTQFTASKLNNYYINTSAAVNDTALSTAGGMMPPPPPPAGHFVKAGCEGCSPSAPQAVTTSTTVHTTTGIHPHHHQHTITTAALNSSNPYYHHHYPALGITPTNTKNAQQPTHPVGVSVTGGMSTAGTWIPPPPPMYSALI